MTMAAAVSRLIVIDEDGVYHRGVELPRGELGTLGCGVRNPLRAKVPPDCDKWRLHGCLFWQEAAA